MRVIVLLLASALCCGRAHSAVPHQINYQGYLTATGGTPVNATVPMVFNLYNNATGGGALYTEAQSVTVTNGVFSVLIGSVTSLPLPFDVPYWLGVKVGTDAEMTPRQAVAASAYAIRSASAELLAPTATVAGSQISGAITTATLPAGNLTGTITGSQLASGLTLGGTTIGIFSGPLTGNVSGSAATFTGALAGDVTGTQGATAIAASTVTGKALTGFVSGAGTVSASDTILTAINKLNGNVAVVEFGSFFGMTAGPGNTGGNDYPATIATSAAGPSVAAGSAINFPRVSAPAVGGIAINNPGAAQINNTEFMLPSVGTYRVTWHISVNEPAQWSLWINTAPTPGGGGLFVEVSTASGAPASVGQGIGTAQSVGDVVFRNSVANSAIQIRNYASPTAVSVTPLPGGTQAQAVSLIIQRLQ